MDASLSGWQTGASFNVEARELESKAVNIDTYFEAVGEYGFYQKLHFVLIGSAWIAIPACMVLAVFTHARPSWKYPGGDLQTSPMPCDAMREGAAVEVVDAWQSVAGEWNLVCNQQWKANLLDSMLFVGHGIGSALLGGLSDSIGRRKAFIISNLMLSVATLGSAAAPTYIVYIILHSGVGFGVGALGCTAYVYNAEFMGAAWQGPTGVAHSGGVFAIGGLVLAGLAYLIPGWRLLTAVIGLFPLLVLLLCSQLPESPRWLHVQGRVDAATSVMQHIAKKNRTEISQELVLVPAIASAVVLSGSSTLRSGVLLGRLLIMMYVWFANSFVFYGLYLNSGNLGGSLHTNFVMQVVVELPAIVLGAYLLDAIGRRVTLSSAACLGGVGCLSCMFLSESLHIKIAAVSGRFGIAALFACTYVYQAELFPTGVRNLAMGICSGSSRIGGVATPGVLLLSAIHSTLPLVIFGVSALVAGLLLVMLPETVGKPLPQSTEDCIG